LVPQRYVFEQQMAPRLQHGNGKGKPKIQPAKHTRKSEENPTEAEACIAGWNFCQRHRLTVGFARVSSCSEPLSAPADLEEFSQKPR
jgi:hypothetical protein